MNSAASFSSDYSEARLRFRHEVEVAGGVLESHAHPAKGLDGGELSTDVAFFGSRGAANIAVLISGTHGVEGFCGSGCQIDLMRRGELSALPSDLGVLMIHAINPFGFSWLRRTNEDNIDLNRNWIDFSKPLPQNPAYDEIHDAICPLEWNASTRAASDAAIRDLNERGGPKAAQAAIAKGQYAHPLGLFFGGFGESWSRKTQASLFLEYLSGARSVAILDYHTGLGPRGYCEKIVTAPVGSDSYERAARWYGVTIASPSGGSSESPEVAGDGLSNASALLPDAKVTAMALEFGTYPISVTLAALQAETWLHAHGDLSSSEGKAIQQQMRDAFYCDEDDWKGMVAGQSLQIFRQTMKGLMA